jgi:hypothetical protein
VAGMVFDYSVSRKRQMKMMKHVLLILVGGIFLSCSSAKYIHDPISRERQKDLSGSRSSSVIVDGLMATLSVVSAAVFETDVEWYPTETRFKKMILQNPTKDTLYVNMLTDVFWDTNNYCDFMDIRIPPEKSCRILCPIDAEYNVYFSNTAQGEDDEMITINTSEKNKLTLNPVPFLSGDP